MLQQILFKLPTHKLLTKKINFIKKTFHKEILYKNYKKKLIILINLFVVEYPKNQLNSENVKNNRILKYNNKNNKFFNKNNNNILAVFNLIDNQI